MKIDQRFIRLSVFRSLVLAAAFVQNIALARLLSLNDLGYFYLSSTVTYLGAAAVFVGADFYLQRRLANISKEKRIHFSSFFVYMLVVASVGGGIVFIFSVLYFKEFAALPINVIIISSVCAFSAVAYYVAMTVKNIAQLADHPYLTNSLFLVESLVKLSVYITLSYLGIESFVFFLIGPFVSGVTILVIGMIYFKKNFKNFPEENYLDSPNKMIRTVCSVGVGGITNWGQLQGYRPLLMTNQGYAERVGGISFMTTLGASVSTAFFSVLAQLKIPELYRERGKVTKRYLIIVLGCGIFMAISALPVGILFLELTKKQELMPFVYVVSIGVIVETGNAILGVLAHHINSKELNTRPIAIAGLVGAVVSLGLISAGMNAVNPYFLVSFSLCVGQILACLYIYLTVKKNDDTF